MNRPHQRIGLVSNAHVGADFEKAALQFFEKQGKQLNQNFPLDIGISQKKKKHCFDLGSAALKIIVECKSHKWTTGGNVPSAKLTVWNEAMYYFLAAPEGYRKIMFVLRDYSEERGKTLAEYYLRTYGHLIPVDVEFWEYDEETKNAKRLAPNKSEEPIKNTRAAF